MGQQPSLAELGKPLELNRPFDQLLLKCVDLGFAGLIFMIPFLMGGREAPGQFALVFLACWTAVCWGVLQIRERTSGWTLTMAEPLLLAGIGLVVLQVVRLPADTLQDLSPRVAWLLPAWQEGGPFPTWNRISFMPAETLDGLMVLVSYVLIFVVAAQRIRSSKDSYRLLIALSVAVVLMALFGLVQYATSNGKFFWFYNHPRTDPSRVVKGAFTNRNHFASFMALGIGPLVWCLTAISLKNKDHKKTSRFASENYLPAGLVSVAISIVIFAALLSLSRAGAITLGVACVVSGIFLYRSAAISGQLAVAAVCVVLLTCGLLIGYGEEQVERRLGQIASADAQQLDSSDGRRAIWKANIEGIQEFPLVGTGIGTHRDVYKLYMEDSGADYRNQFTHAENGYLQVGLESGLVGLGLLLAAFLLALFWTTKGLLNRQRPLVASAQAAALSCLLASLVHSGADFVWYAPACVIPVILMAASACRLRQLQKAESGSRALGFPVPRLTWAAAAVCVAAAAVWMLPAKYRRMEAERYWYSYLRMSLKGEITLVPQNRAAIITKKLVAVSKTVDADPSFARAHARLAELCNIAFHELQMQSENPMSLAMIRDASNTFEDPGQRYEWLSQRALGERHGYLLQAIHHSKRSLELCPLQGQQYLYLSEMQFVDRESDFDDQVLVDQAMRVRPHDPKVLFGAGVHELRNGHQEAGTALWQRAFGLSRRYQSPIINQIAAFSAADRLVQIFDPDVEALALMAARYRELGRGQDLQYCLRAFTNASLTMADDTTVPTERRIRFVLAAQKACDELGDVAAATACYQKAIDVSPRDYRAHYQFGMWLSERKNYSAAADQFDECAKIRPGDDRVRRLAVALRNKQLDLQLAVPVSGNPSQMATQPANGPKTL